MRVRAIAVPRNNATTVGSLELECTPQGLLMLYLGVGAYRPGYAPAAISSGTTILAPWPQVSKLSEYRDEIRVSLDPKLTPHHKLCLVNFADGDTVLTQELKRRRWLLRIASAGLMLSVGLSLLLQLPDWSPQLGQAGALLIACGVAVGIVLLSLFAEQSWLPKPVPSEKVRRQFAEELRHYCPAQLESGAPSEPPPQVLDLPQLVGLLPRSTMAIVITLSASALAAILTSSWLLGDDENSLAPKLAEAPERRPLPAPLAAAPTLTAAPSAIAAPSVTAPEAQTAPAPTPTQVVKAAPADAESVVLGKECRCDQADSVLWNTAFPRLSTLLIQQRLRRHKDHHHLELELGVVNNGSETIKEVSLLVQFYEGEGKTRTKDRPLYYEGRLRPAQAIKWSVQARGTSFLVVNPVKASLEPGKNELASADAFAKLLQANHRPVRLHGAMMLAYLGDPRAKAGAFKLREALREQEAPYLERVLGTLGNVRSCNWTFSESGRLRQVEACVHNASGRTQQGLALKVRALDRRVDHRSPVVAPPLVVSEKLWKIDGALESQQGQRVAVTLDTDNPDGRVAKEFELFVDREEVLY